MHTDNGSAERTLGGDDVLRPYIRNYVNTFIGHSITTDQWKEHLYSYFEDKKEKLDSIDWNVSVPWVVQVVHVCMDYAGMVLRGRNDVAS